MKKETRIRNERWASSNHERQLRERGVSHHKNRHHDYHPIFHATSSSALWAWIRIVWTIVVLLLAFCCSTTTAVSTDNNDDQEQQGTCPYSIPTGACRASSSPSSVPFSISNSEELNKKKSSSSSSSFLECNVFMAPSTIGDIGNMGMYTAKELQPGETLNYPEIAIPLLFREWGQHPPGYTDGRIWDNYIWEGAVMDLESYDDTNREACRAVFVPGIGCTVNSLLDMHNVHSTHGSIYDTADLHQLDAPGVGAFSPYHSAQTKTSRAVPAGAELFAKYGDYWIPTIPGVQVTFDKPLNEAEAFVRKDYLPFVLENKAKMTAKMKEALWDFTRNTGLPTTSQALSNLPRQSWSQVEEYYLNQQEEQQSCPSSNNDDDNGDEMIDYSQHEDASIVRHFIRQGTVRSIEWLNTFGYCQDHLRPGRSTLRQAGRGAFATRDLPKGTIVGFAPLIHLGQEGRVLFNISYSNVGGHMGERHAYDLILNYSFGHANSSVLLTPYGGMVNYINHQPTIKSSSSPGTANVRIQWPEHELVSHKPDWFQQDTFFLKNTRKKIGLSFEYVALRDIAEGEEVFMDYGSAWEQAWEEHVRQWQPLEDAHLYVHSTEYANDTNIHSRRHNVPIRDGNGIPYYTTVSELETNPYPPNLHTMCYESFTTTTAPMNPEQQQQQQADDESYFVWINPMFNTHHRAYCHVVARRVNQLPTGGYKYEYDIDLLLRSTTKDDENGNNPTTEQRWIRVHHVPYEGIQIYDKAFSTDWHMPNTFRHEITIPDDMMPEAWKNGPPV